MQPGDYVPFGSGYFGCGEFPKNIDPVAQGIADGLAELGEQDPELAAEMRDLLSRLDES